MMLAAALFPQAIKKELKELKIASVILFVGIITFILLFAYQLLFDGAFLNEDENYD